MLCPGPPSDGHAPLTGFLLPALLDHAHDGRSVKGLPFVDIERHQLILLDHIVDRLPLYPQGTSRLSRSHVIFLRNDLAIGLTYEQAERRLLPVFRETVA